MTSESPKKTTVKTIQGIVVPDKLPLTGKRRRQAERARMLAKQGLLDEDLTIPAVPEEVPAATQPEATEKTPPDNTQQEFLEIPVSAIRISRYQPRLVINPERLEALADEIHAAGGLNNPVNVLEIGDGTYELITGERRWRAHQLLGWDTIKARVRDLTPTQARIIALTDNTAGEPLTDFEEALALKNSLESGEFSSISDLSRKMGKNKGNISKLMSFFKLPEPMLKRLESNPKLISQAVATSLGTLSESHPEIVLEAFERLESGHLQQSTIATWVKNQIRAMDRNRRSGTGGGSRVVSLMGSKDGLTQAKITGKRIVLECSKDADPSKILKAMAEAMGMSIVEGNIGRQPASDVDTKYTE